MVRRGPGSGAMSINRAARDGCVWPTCREVRLTCCGTVRATTITTAAGELVGEFSSQSAPSTRRNAVQLDALTGVSLEPPRSARSLATTTPITSKLFAAATSRVAPGSIMHDRITAGVVGVSKVSGITHVPRSQTNVLDERMFSAETAGRSVGATLDPNPGGAF